MSRTTWTASGGILLGLALVLMVGCSSGSDWQNYTEQWIRSGVAHDETAPDWVSGDLPKSETHAFLVGRGVGYNVLDERAAYDAAMADALRQIGAMVATRVRTTLDDVDGTDGLRILPGQDRYASDPAVEQLLTRQSKLTVDALAGDLEPRSVYWEQWYVQEEPENTKWFTKTESRRMKRYKCWLLVAVPRDKLEQRLQMTADMFRYEAAAAQGGTIYTVVDNH